VSLLPLMASEPEPQIRCGAIPVKAFDSWRMPAPPLKMGGLYRCIVYGVPADVVGIKLVLRYEHEGKIWTLSQFADVSELGASVIVDIPEDIRILSRDVHLLSVKHTFSADH